MTTKVDPLQRRDSAEYWAASEAAAHPTRRDSKLRKTIKSAVEHDFNVDNANAAAHLAARLAAQEHEAVARQRREREVRETEAGERAVQQLSAICARLQGEAGELLTAGVGAAAAAAAPSTAGHRRVRAANGFLRSRTPVVRMTSQMAWAQPAREALLGGLFDAALLLDAWSLSRAGAVTAAAALLPATLRSANGAILEPRRAPARSWVLGAPLAVALADALAAALERSVAAVRSLLSSTNISSGPAIGISCARAAAFWSDTLGNPPRVPAGAFELALLRRLAPPALGVGGSGHYEGALEPLIKAVEHAAPDMARAVTADIVGRIDRCAASDASSPEAPLGAPAAPPRSGSEVCAADFDAWLCGQGFIQRLEQYLALLRPAFATMERLYQSTGGALQWSKSGGWLVTDNVSSYWGIVAEPAPRQPLLATAAGGGGDDTDGSEAQSAPEGELRLLSLRLPGNNVRGELSEAFGPLDAQERREQERARRRWRQEGGPPVEPAPISALQWLKTIDLEGNGLTGRIPRCFFGLPNLQELRLASNAFSGDVPSAALCRATALRILRLQNNKLTGALPTDLGGCTALVRFECGNNAFSGALVAHGMVPGAAKEADAALDDGFGDGGGAAPPSPAPALSLPGRGGSSSALSASGPSAASGLEVLHLSGNEKLHCSSFSGFVAQLTGEYNRVDVGTGVASATCSPLSSGRASSPSIAPMLAPQPSHTLRSLHLSHCGLTGPLPAGLATCLELRSIRLAHNSLSGAVPREWGMLSALTELDISHNKLGCPPFAWRERVDAPKQTIPRELGKCTAITHLDLSMNRLRGNIPPTLAECTGLRILDLSGNELRGTIPPQFGRCEGLLDIILRSNLLEGRLPSTFEDLPQLRVLDVSFNKLGGSLPRWIGDPCKLELFHCARNRFSGDLPAGIVFVHDLDLRWNDRIMGTKVLGAFKQGDKDQSGFVDFEEFLSICAACGIEEERKVIKAVYREIDADDSGEIDFAEFLVAVKMMNFDGIS